MLRWIAILIFLLPSKSLASDPANLELFFQNLGKLEFEKARRAARQVNDQAMQAEMLQLADILFYEGQVDSSRFNVSENKIPEDQRTLLLIRTLSAGYYSLFYDQLKGDAYKNFYAAYQLAKESENPYLIKACLIAFMKYFNLEIAQNSDSYQPYLDHFERLRGDCVDSAWTTIYQLIFYSKSLKGRHPNYMSLADSLDVYEKAIEPASPVMAHLYYEKALQLDLKKDFGNAEKYYQKTLNQAADYPFLRYHRFFCLIKLMMLEARRNDFQKARRYLKSARIEVDKADTLRSNYHLNFFEARFLKAQNRYDSAYDLLWKAYVQDFKLDFRTNTLEVNRLNVELATQEKENANLRLSESRTWLAFALVGVLLLSAAGYFAYANERSKDKMQLRENELQSMKLEKLLRDQEMVGIDAMIEGQEKERQRIANDLHDNLGSLLVTLKLHFQTIRIKSDRIDSEQKAEFQKTNELIDEAYLKVRTLAHARNAGVNAQEGLVPAVKNFASKVSIINKLVIQVEEHGMQDRLENSIEITIFRIIQELVTNVIKHAEATEAIIHLTHHKDAINLMIEDNGIGFDISQIKPDRGMGLYSIQRRIENLGGKVTIDSISEKGTTVIIDIPLT